MLGGLFLQGTCKPKVRCLQRTVGKFQHAALPLRHPLSVLQTLFFSESERRAPPKAWTSERWEEHLHMIVLLPLLSCNLSADFDTILTATDASETRVGGSECLLGSPEQIQELCRNIVFKGDYSNLDEVAVPGLAAEDLAQLQSDSRVRHHGVKQEL